MKTTLFISLLFFFLVSCDEEVGPKNYDIAATIWLKDKDTGNDLLNPTTPNAYNSDDIRVYAVDAKGIKTELYDTKLDAPRNFSIIPYSNNGVSLNLCKLFPYFGSPNVMNRYTTLIAWKPNVVDTITCEITQNDLTITNKVWYNSQLKYDVSNPTDNKHTLPNVERLIEVLK